MSTEHRPLTAAELEGHASIALRHAQTAVDEAHAARAAGDEEKAVRLAQRSDHCTDRGILLRSAAGIVAAIDRLTAATSGKCDGLDGDGLPCERPRSHSGNCS